jgi:DNA-binding LacI/PurR family transcriptional regulator
VVQLLNAEPDESRVGAVEIDAAPTAFVRVNDVMAFGARRCIESLGLEIGTDIALTGYHAAPVADLIGLASVRRPPRSAGVQSGCARKS